MVTDQFSHCHDLGVATGQYLSCSAWCLGRGFSKQQTEQVTKYNSI